MYQPGTSSGLIPVTAGTQVMTGPGVLALVQITAASGATGTIMVYDGNSTSGTVLSIGSATAGNTQNSNVEGTLAFNQGLFVVVTGTGAQGVIVYRRN